MFPPGGLRELLDYQKIDSTFRNVIPSSGNGSITVFSFNCE